MSWPAPTRQAHERFCTIEGWAPARNVRRALGHHVTYELAVPDGRVLRTRISHPVNREGYGPALWRHTLRDQLCVTEPEFWACVQDRQLPDRGGARQAPPDALPASLVHQLIHEAGLPESEVAAMTKDEAVARMQQFWTTGQ